MIPPDLEVKAALQIGSRPGEVFDAIVDPTRMSRYFISESTGPLQEGKTVMWQFPEFEGENPVRGGKIEKNQYISFFWKNDQQELLVEINLAPAGDHSTVVTITEKSMKNDEAGIRWLQSNTEGWANFLACLKAYLEYGINLRKGGFDFYRTGKQ